MYGKGEIIRMRRKVFFLALLTARPIFAQVPVNQGQLEANKKLALDFFKAGIKNPDRMAQYLADDYVQHNPRFVKFGEAHHVSGKQGFVMAIESWILGPTAKQGEPAPPPAPRTPALVVAEGDIVTIIWKQMQPDPNDHSQTYESFAFDTFRIKNGKLAEHWDGATKRLRVMPGQAPIARVSWLTVRGHTRNFARNARASDTSSEWRHMEAA